MRALVTGASGFVGRHMIEHLDATGWDTSGLDIRAGYDALDYFRVSRSRWDLVVHAAASSPHRTAIDTEHQHMARNLQLDAAMFDWAVRTGQRHVVYLSSSAAYPISLQGPHARPLHEDLIDPEAPFQPDSVYGWTKLTGERMAMEARKSGLPVTVVRPFSGYGEDQSPDFPFRAILDRVIRREDPLYVWGSGLQVRDWIHIDDVVAGIMAVAESGTADPVNLCTGVGTSMYELASIAARQYGSLAPVHALRDKPGGVEHRVGDAQRFRRFYTPKISLDEGVARALSA